MQLNIDGVVWKDLNFPAIRDVFGLMDSGTLTKFEECV
jgi:hypothetical protein